MATSLLHGSLYAVLAVQTGLLIIAGAPLAWWMALQVEKQKPLSVGALLAAPLYGVVISTWLSGLAFRFGLSSTVPVLVIPLLATAALACTRAARTRALVKPAVAALTLLVVALAAVLVTNTGDIAPAGLDHYFPRTNDDTFCYLGQIDQVRAQGLALEPMTYPAGYTPCFAGLRAGVSAFLTTQANLLDLAGNAAFFATLRLMLVLTAIGIIALLLLVGVRSVVAIAGAFALFVGGNFMLHQVLQQFLSSSTGVVAGIAALTLAAIALVSSRRTTWLLAGAACGIYSTISAEAFAVITAGILGAIVFQSVTVADPRSSRFTRVAVAVAMFATGFGIGCLPFAPRVWHDTLIQGQASTGGHPGDWIARFGYILQASGVVPFYKNGPFSAFAIGQQVCAIGVLVMLIAGEVLFAYRCLRRQDPNLSRLAPLASGLMALVAFLALFAVGRGYVMLKMWEYHMFMPAIVIGLWIDRGFALVHTPRARAALAMVCACVIGLFVYVSWRPKWAAFSEYDRNVAFGPALEDYLYPAAGEADHVRSIRPDLRGFSLNLFLYQNRFRPVPIVFEGSNRFHGRETDLASHVFMMEHPDILDINRPGVAEPSTGTLVPFENYVEIVPEPDWLPASGRDRTTSFRLAGHRGQFRIWLPEPGRPLVLHVRLARGPDFPQDGKVEVALAGRTIMSLDAPEVRSVPTDYDIPFQSPAAVTLDGSIVVSGVASGPRELVVSRLFVQSPNDR